MGLWLAKPWVVCCGISWPCFRFDMLIGSIIKSEGLEAGINKGLQRHANKITLLVDLIVYYMESTRKDENTNIRVF
jgi:hypothetical protein